MFNIDILWDHEFGEQEAGDSLILVLEKEKAISELQALVGRSQVKEKADFMKYKKKSVTSSYSFNQA